MSSRKSLVLLFLVFAAVFGITTFALLNWDLLDLWKNSRIGPGKAAKEPDRLRVAFFLATPASDWGWSYQHNKARLGLEARLRGQMSTTVLENLSDPAAVEQQVEHLYHSGHRLFFMTSDAYEEPVLILAKKYPRAKFMQWQGRQELSNLGSYGLRDYEPVYVCGVVAALMTSGDDSIGFFSAQPSRFIKWLINSFTLGVRSVEPDRSVRVRYGKGWFDPASEVTAIEAIAREGMDLVYILSIVPGPAAEAAERAGMYVLSHFSDLSSFAPTKWVTGTQWNFQALYADVVREVLRDTWKPTFRDGGLREKYLGLSLWNPTIPDAVRNRAGQVLQAIAAEQLPVFAGPIRDQSGKLRIPAGTTASFSKLSKEDWMVEGVVEIPAGNASFPQKRLEPTDPERPVSTKQ